ncbi:isocitrate lyase/phosphoenolpyruvate mutase family protein [Modestobacter versicolor]|uniref:Isocitrate lyase/phosphoenolpyruvate mutase family protein n=1 Tax=Modestobacter versicolor TaxID=429133 RepID=A0A323V7N8_9ACTN|nr:isocitrate lyase/phosphoenolpyruvate mutase family protein [Modestobacter versicolor]PZA20829.1 isocitrate lyase/phosphoenolpyruvate mutase family protein [Modestobacter versicolor]
MHRGPVPLLLPNAWDVASALALVADGHPAVGTTSLGVAAAAGLPDATRAGRARTVELAARLADLPVAVTVDLEDGFSDDPAEVAELVGQLPVAGVNLEDSTAGRLVDPARHAARVAAVKQACPTVFLNARVDTWWLGEQAGLTATVARAERYVAAGADGVFVPGRLTAAEIGTLTRELPVPVNVLATADHPLPRLADLGVRRVSTGSLLFRASLDAAVAVARALRDGQPAPPATSYAEVDARSAALDGPG